MQRLKLKRVRRKEDKPSGNTIRTIGFNLNGHWIDVSVELNDKVFVTNNFNNKVYQLVNEVS